MTKENIGGQPTWVEHLSNRLDIQNELFEKLEKKLDGLKTDGTLIFETFDKIHERLWKLERDTVETPQGLPKEPVETIEGYSYTPEKKTVAEWFDTLNRKRDNVVRIGDTLEVLDIKDGEVVIKIMK